MIVLELLELMFNILYMYILKLEGYIILFLIIVNFSCVVFGEFMFLVVEVWFCSWVFFYCKGGVVLLVIDIIVLNVVLEFFCSCMKNIELSCEGLVMEYIMIKLFFL